MSGIRHLRSTGLVLLGLWLLVGCAPTPGVVTSPGPVGEPVQCQGRIVFVGRVSGEWDVLVINADGSGLVNVTNGGGQDRAPTWSPDGEYIAFERHVGNTDLYVASVDGSELLRLTELPSREFAPTWSPDGEQLAFASQSGYATELYAVSAQGGDAYTLTDSNAHKPDLAWSPDGKLIAFTMYNSYNQGDIYLVAAPGFAETGAVNLTQHAAHDCCPSWSPDGQRLLFLSSRGSEGEGSPGGRAADVLVSSGKPGDVSLVNEAVRAITTVMPAPANDLYLVGADGSGLTRLTDGQGRVRQAAWSPDGSHIVLVSDRSGSYDIYILSSGGGEMERLTDSAESDGHPTWSPDGACLAFLTHRGSQAELNVMNADGSGLRTLAQDVDFDSRPGWVP